jgi:hypothetical protein
MNEMKVLNGFEIVDAKAREDIETLKNSGVDVNLTDYYTKTETDTKITEAVDNIDIPDPDLSQYYTKTEIDNKGYLTEHQDLSGKADKDHTHDQYLTELPEHTHDQYLTEHQSLSNYYTKSETDNKITEVVEAIPDVDLSNYYTKSEVDTALTEVESPPEVYVGTDEPTDENIKIWVDPSNTIEYALKSDIPTDEYINSLIDTKLGVIENGSY